MNTPVLDATPTTLKKHLWLRRTLWGIVLSVMLLFVFMIWLVTTSSGLHTALFRLPAWFGVHIHAEQTEGTLWRGFSAKNIRIQTDTDNIALASFVFDWDASALSKQRLLHIRLIELGEMTIISTGSSVKKPSPPPKMPEDVGLPIGVKIDRIVSNGILWGKNKDVLMTSAEINYSYLNGQHRLNIPSLNTLWGHLQGEAKLENVLPFVVDGHVDLDGFINREAAKGEILLSGSLKELLLQGDLSSANMIIDADAQISPFASNAVERVHHVTLNVANVNPQDFWKSAPQADLSLFADLWPDQTGSMLNGQIVTANAVPLPVDHNGIPLSQAYALFTVNPEGVLSISPLEADFLHKGKIVLTGTLGDQLDLSIQLDHLTVADLMAGKPALPLSGSLYIKGSHDNPDITWQFSRGKLNADGLLTLRTAGKRRQQTLTLEKARFTDGGGGSAILSGRMNLFGEESARLLFQSKNFNPAVLGSDYPQGTVNGRLEVDGQFAQNINFIAKINLPNSMLSNMPLTALGEINYRDNHLAPSRLHIALGENHILGEGTLGKAGDQLNLDISAPSLARFGFGLTGALEAQGFIAGDIHTLNTRLRGRADAFAFRDLIKLRQLHFDLTASPDIQAPLNIDIAGKNLVVGSTDIDHLTATAQGTLEHHRFAANAALTAAGKPYRADIAAQGGMNHNRQWTGTVSRFNLGGSLNVLLDNPIRLSASQSSLNLGAARWHTLGGVLDLQSLSWQQKAGFATRGKAAHLHLADLENIVPLPFKQNLVFTADWDIQYNENARGNLNIQRVSGDLVLPARTQTLGLNKLTLDTRLSAGRIHNTLVTETRFGNATAQLDIAQKFGDSILKAPISGNLKLNADDLGRIKYLLPVGLDLDGALQADVTIHGTLGDPLLNGEMNAQKLAYYDSNNGIRLDNGTLKSHFDGKKWLIAPLAFNHTEGGVLEATGSVARVGVLPDVNLDVKFTHYPVLNHPDRKVVLSGQSQIHYTDQTGLALTGALKLDKALFDFPKSGMPALSEDVVIIGAPEKEKSASVLLALNLILDLNDAFRFSGKGLDILMGGKLALTAKPKENMNILGTVKVVTGRYKAYGQDLEIDHGQISFIGPIDNPVLNIRARRRMSPVGAGVEVTGSANHPRAVLIADTPMSDKDKLAWLVLGRAAAGESDDAALAAAAGAWLAGGINDKIGLVDDIGLGSRTVRNPATGEMNPAEQMLTVGKHLTNRIYLGYEYGISSATQAVKLVYQLSKNIQLIGRVGSDSVGGEVRYSRRFD